MNTNKDLVAFFELLTEISDEKGINQAADELINFYAQQSNFKTHSTIYAAFSKIIQKSKEEDALAMVMIVLEQVVSLCKVKTKNEDYVFSNWLDDIFDNASVEYQRYSALMVLNDVVDDQQKTIRHADDEIAKIKRVFHDMSAYQEQVRVELNGVQKNTRTLEKNINDLFENTQTKLGDANRELGELRKSIVSEVVAVLGIFVSIVVACFGTITIIGNVSLLLSEDVPLYKVLAAFFAVALILLDVLSLLIYSIGRLCGKSITASCKFGSCEKCERKKGKCNAFWHFFHKQYHLIIMNIVLVGLMILTLLIVPGMERYIDDQYHGETAVADTAADEPTTETDWVTEFQTAPDDTSVQTE